MKETIFEKDCQARFHGTFGNGKLGKHVMAVSYVPGNGLLHFKDGRLVSDCLGTCSKVDCSQCGKFGICYAINSYVIRPNVTIARIENTLQLRNDMKKHFQDLEKAIRDNGVKVVRYTESGELESYEQLINLYNVAIRNPETRFYLYTKNYQVLRCFFDFRVLPTNMVVLISVWGDQGRDAWNEFKKYRNVKCFAVNSDMQVTCNCPAYYKDENGKTKRDSSATCEKCRLCYDSKAKIIGCLEH